MTVVIYKKKVKPCPFLSVGSSSCSSGGVVVVVVIIVVVVVMVRGDDGMGDDIY